MNTAILVNLSANNNTGGKKWLSIRNDVLSMMPSVREVITYEPPFQIQECILNLLTEKKIDCIISAGGDGSLNYIINSIMKSSDDIARKIHLGAIGLGSSNDFLKPVLHTIRGIPLKIGLDNSRLTDIGKVTFINKDAQCITKYFIINASIGITANANLLFNRGDFFINHVKSRFVNLAIIYAAIKTIVFNKNSSLQLNYNHEVKNVKISSLSVVKNPNISGSFKYDQKTAPDDGMLGLNYCHDMNLFELLKVLFDLKNGSFSGKPKRISTMINNLKIRSDKFIALETDGEIEVAKDIEFALIPKAINVLG